MANRPAPALALGEGDRAERERLTRASSVPAGRARIVLPAADGVGSAEIAERRAVAGQTVLAWRARSEDRGRAGRADEARSGWPVPVDRRRIISETVQPPKSLGVTHWSSWLLAATLQVATPTIAKAWRAYGIQSWRTGSFRWSTDPELEATVVDVVGLYWIRRRTRSCWVWTSSPRSRLWSGQPRSCRCNLLFFDRAPRPRLPPAWHDNPRHSLEVATGTVTGRCQDQHRQQEILVVLRQIAHASPTQDLHLALDNDAAHQHPAVTAELAATPRVQPHVTPTQAC